MASEFANKVVLITGSSSGIGADAAVRFSSYGAKVVVTGRNVDKLNKVTQKCNKVSPNGNKALQVAGDITNNDDAKRLLETTIKTFGQLDVLVNNAGAITLVNSIADANAWEAFEPIMNTNVRSVFYLTHLAVPYLEKTKGNIINISSAGSVKPIPGYMIPCMSKAALDMFTKCLALELGPKGIRVNSVNPGPVRTDCLENAGVPVEQSEIIYGMLEKGTPLGRIGKSEDITNCIEFLASNQKASFLTGTFITADGGLLHS